MIFWCHHVNQTTPRRDATGEYRRCLDCGERIAWSWPDTYPIRPPRRETSDDWNAFSESSGSSRNRAFAVAEPAGIAGFRAPVHDPVRGQRLA
jgi:hypothetical protein